MFGLQQVGETVELLEAWVGVVLAVRPMTWDVDRDGVLDDVLAVIRAEGDRQIWALRNTPRALYWRQRGSSCSANSRSYSAACSARMWMMMTSGRGGCYW